LALDFELSFAGVPFRPVLPQGLMADIGRLAYLDNLSNPVEDPPEWGDYLPNPPTSPGARLYELFYPWGARRFATFRGLMHKNDVTQLLPLVVDDHGSSGKTAKAAAFIMQQGDPAGKVNTNLWLLPPQPLTGINDVPDTYVVTLVDERYFWRWCPVTLESRQDSTGYLWDYTWDSMIQKIALACGITVTYTAVESAYGKPDPSSPFFAYSQPAGPLLDAACAHIGRVLCRKADGTYEAVRYETANQNAETARLSAVRFLGGPAFTDAQAHEPTAANAVIPPGLNRPPTVSIVSGVWDDKAGTHGVNDANIPADDRTDFLKGESSDIGTSYKGTLPNGYKAVIKERGTKAPNEVDQQIVNDWYDWNARTLSESYRGVWWFEPKAGLDATYCYGDCPTTTVRPNSLNYEWTTFWHWDGNVTNDWPRSALLIITRIDPNVGTAWARIISPTDTSFIGNQGIEWPEVVIASNSQSFPQAALYSFYPGDVVDGSYLYTIGGSSGGSSPGSTPTTYYSATGRHQSPFSYSTPFGFVTPEEQYLGQSVKHFGALSLQLTGTAPRPRYVYAGVAAARAGQAGGQAGYSGNGSWSVLNSGGVVVGGNCDSASFLLGTGIPLQPLYAATLNLGSMFNQNGFILDSFNITPGTYFVTMGRQGLMELVIGTQSKEVLYSKALGVATGWSLGGFHYGTGSSWLQSIGNGGLAVDGYMAPFGGYMVPDIAVINNRYASGQGVGASGGSSGWIWGRTQMVPLGVIGIPGTPGPYTLPPQPSIPEFPPDPNGPLVFINGLYVGGGHGLGLIGGVAGVNSGGTGNSTLVSGQVMVGNGTSPVDQLQNTRTNGESLELKIGTNRWIGFSLGSH
jgi:hypothetical protein